MKRLAFDVKAKKRGLLLALAILPLWACSQQASQAVKATSPLSAQDSALKHKFRGLGGGELRVDSTFATARAVIIDPDTGYLFNIGMGAFRPGADSVSSYGGGADGDRLPMPKRLRLLRYPEDARYLGEGPGFVPMIDAKPIVDVIVPVAERIPEGMLDELRKHGGVMRLKFRIHPATLLVGWDIDRAYDPKKKDPYRPPIGPRYSWVGGDFREAIVVEGRIVEHGWYIDPKTKQRIETDY